jgi:hypothetical protein
METFEFSQLSPKAKKVALDNNREILINDNWFEDVINEWQQKLDDLGYYDTQIYFTGFHNQGDGACFTYKGCDSFNEKFKVWALKNRSIKAEQLSGRVYISGVKIGMYCHENSIENHVEIDFDGFKMMQKAKDFIQDEIEKNVNYFQKEISKKIYRDLKNCYSALTSDSIITDELNDLNVLFNEDGTNASIEATVDDISEIGYDILMATKSLTKEQRNKLIELSLNVKNKATKNGFPIYVNLRSYVWGDEIEIVVKHYNNNPENSIELDFVNGFEYRKERGVKITDKLVFDVTTGSYDGNWDESTISINKYFDIIEASIEATVDDEFDFNEGDYVTNGKGRRGTITSINYLDPSFIITIDYDNGFLRKGSNFTISTSQYWDWEKIDKVDSEDFNQQDDVNTPDITIEKNEADERGLNPDKITYSFNYSIQVDGDYIEIDGTLEENRFGDIEIEPGQFNDEESEDYWANNFEDIEEQINDYWVKNYIHIIK